LKERTERTASERKCREADCFSETRTWWAGFAEGRASSDGMDNVASAYEAPYSSRSMSVDWAGRLCRERLEAHGEETQTRRAHKLGCGDGGWHCKVIGRWIAADSMCRRLSCLCLRFTSPHTIIYVTSVHLHTPTSLHRAQAQLTFAPCQHRNTLTCRVWASGVTYSHSSWKTDLGISSVDYTYCSSIYSSRVSIPTEDYSPRWSGPETCLPRQPRAVQLALTRPCI